MRTALFLAVATAASALGQSQAVGTKATTGGATAPQSVLRVVTVPWLGDPNNDHVVYSGGSLVLQAVAYPDTGVPLQSATWDPGDGSPPQSVPITNPRVIQLTHAYTGAVGQPFVARIEIVDANNNRASDVFRVRVQSRTLNVDVNMAIDKGLWNLHRRMVLGSSGGIDIGYWTESGGRSRAAPTASALLAFEVNAHLESGDRTEDPYVEVVERGLAGLMLDLRSLPISTQAAGNPDTNGNGIGIESSGFPVSQLVPYVGGQVVDALVATGTPNTLTRTGGTNIIGRSYRDIVTDLMDAYYYGQTETPAARRGGWRYGWNTDADNSASQWYAIGGIAVTRDQRGFQQAIPQFVRDENRIWLTTSQTFNGSNTGIDGRFGYTDAATCVDLACVATTASGLVEMVADEQLSTTPRWLAAERFIVRNFSQLVSGTPTYGMFALAKAMRLALPAPIRLMDGTFDWYSDPQGLATRLVNAQQVDGSWDDARWTFDDLPSAWAIVILSPTIIAVPPVAVCRVDPRRTGINVPIDLDGSQSFHLDPPHRVVRWDWDFDCNGTVDATGERARHPGYATVGEKCVRLIVYDERIPAVASAPVDCRISITPPPFPPNSNPGGPYVLCLGTNQRLILDGSRSTDLDGFITRWAWDYRPQPLDLSFDDAFGVTTDVTAYFTSLGPGRYDVGLRVTDNDNNDDTDFTTVTVYSLANCPIHPPEFTPQTPCGRTVMATAGAPLDIEICATDQDQGDIVTLNVIGSLPPGASMVPALPVLGNPACSHLQWTPALNQVGRYRVAFRAVDRDNLSTDCAFDIEVAECFLVLAESTGNDRVTAGTHVFSTGLHGVTAIYPVTRESLPSILAMPAVVRAGKPGGIALDPGLEPLGAAQVFMWNPQMFPNNAEQSTDVLELWLDGPGRVEWIRHGPSDGMSIGLRTRLVGGQTYMQFPFTINGM